MSELPRDTAIVHKPSATLTVDELLATESLIDRGYGYNVDDLDGRIDNVLTEYGFDDQTWPNVQNWFALQGDRVIGSIGANVLDEDTTDQGRHFWNEIRNRLPLLHRQTAGNRRLAKIWGAVVDPGYQGLGLGGELYQTLARELNVPLIDGQTRTP